MFLIAERFGLQPDTIFWANTETLQDNVHLLHIGTELYILPVNGVYHQSDGKLTIAEIAGQYDVDPETILLSEYNQLSTGTRDYVPPNGLRIVVPGGRREYISWQAPIRTGTAGGTNPQGALHPGSCPGGYIGSGGLGNFIDPLGSISYFVTNEFALWHAGIDLAAPLGTTIYAAETGVVVFAGWHLNGYGELVILDHGSGYTTYYAHLSDRFVQCGQQVSKGQMIGLMGTTGYSTGVHLHFEVRYNDVPQNPRFYIDFSGTPFYDG
nr:M23 family metallopeptidase [Anaerolineae bacterium]